MVAIESAYWGDEKQSHNITKRILKMVSGGKLDVTANEGLIPPLETSADETIKLSTAEEAQITRDAEAQCGPADQTCLEFQKQRLRASKLREKETATQSTANVIKGRRLTLIVNRDGERKKIVVPDGNKYTLEGIVESIKNKGEFEVPSKEILLGNLVGSIGAILGITIYVLGIIIPYIFFSSKGFGPLVLWPVGIASAILPYSGYFIILGYYLTTKNFNS